MNIEDPRYRHIIDKYKIDNVRSIILKYDKLYKKYYIYVSHIVQEKHVAKRKPIIALDPGEKHFLTAYGLDECITVGSNMRDKILKLKNKSKKYEKILKSKKNKHGK